jgi:hypothetical protein
MGYYGSIEIDPAISRAIGMISVPPGEVVMT